MFADGRPWFGPSKTIRGIVLATLATAAAAAVLGLGWKCGGLVGIVAMAGGLLASFIKRRLGLAPSSQAIGLDQIPESLFPHLASRLFTPVTALDIAVATILQEGMVVKLASWKDESHMSLAPHEPEVTDMVVVLDDAA